MIASEKVQEHLKRLYERENLSESVAYETLVNNWEQKEDWYSRQMNALKMEEVSELAGDTPRAVLGLSFSGSLIALYVPDGQGLRKMEYASIKLRGDVPDLVQDEAVKVKDSFLQGKSLHFSQGKLEHSSPLYKIAAAPADLNDAEQNRRLSEAMIFLTNSFAKLNRNSFQAANTDLDHFTKRNMVAYMAKKHHLSQQATRDLLDDFFTLMETGILMGENVALGKLGRIRIKERPPQKARVMRNPKDGSELMVAAKPAQMVPKMRFSDYFKSRTGLLPVEEDQ